MSFQPQDRADFEKWIERVHVARLFPEMLENGECPLCTQPTLTYEWCGSSLVLQCSCMPGLPIPKEE